MAFQALQEGPKQITIFGREPTVWLGFIEAALAAVTAFGLGERVGLSQETYGIWVTLIAAIMGFLVAFLTRDTMLGVSLGLVKALIAFVAIYGMTLSDQQVGSIITLVPIIIALIQRPQTAPIVAGEVIPRQVVTAEPARSDPLGPEAV